MSFASDTVGVPAAGAVELGGALSIRGTTGRVVTLGCTGVPGVGPSGLRRVAVDLETVIDRTQFGLAW